MQIRQTVHFSGRVQGVGFRYTTQQIARAHAVAGFVQNLPDGRVLLVCEGEQPAVSAFLGAVHAALCDNIDHAAGAEGAATGEFGDPRPGALVIRR